MLLTKKYDFRVNDFIPFISSKKQPKFKKFYFIKEPFFYAIIVSYIQFCK